MFQFLLQRTAENKGCKKNYTTVARNSFSKVPNIGSKNLKFHVIRDVSRALFWTFK
jgi:hypothetical protein